MIAEELQLPISLNDLQTVLKKRGVTSAYLFGSFARREEGPDSDIDLLVSLDPSRSLMDLGGLQFELEQRLGRRVDITTQLHPKFAPYIQPDLVEIL